MNKSQSRTLVTTNPKWLSLAFLVLLTLFFVNSAVAAPLVGKVIGVTLSTCLTLANTHIGFVWPGLTRQRRLNRKPPFTLAEALFAMCANQRVDPICALMNNPGSVSTCSQNEIDCLPIDCVGCRNRSRFGHADGLEYTKSWASKPLFIRVCGRAVV